METDMGLLDNLVGKAADIFGGEAGQGNPQEAVLAMLTSGEGGGLGNLVQTFQNNGLGDVISSWIGKGQNLPISAEQIQQVLGNEQIQNLASRFGISTENLSATLAEQLPGVIDKLTPDGAIPEGGLLAQGLEFLKSKLA
jgi:uncharacterized protein YidB (DUF937 family)